MATQNLPEVLATICIEGEARKQLLSFAAHQHMSPDDVLSVILNKHLQEAAESTLLKQLNSGRFCDRNSSVLRTV